MRAGFLKILGKRDFSRIWTAQVLSQLVSNMLTFALILHIYDLTGSLTTISLVMIATTIPSVIFGPFSGVLTDRVRYKKVLIYTSILRFLVALLLIPAANNTLAILEIIFLMATITQFFAPAEMSSIPLIVDRDEIIAANSVYITTLYGALIIGYGIAGPLLAVIGSKDGRACMPHDYVLAAASSSAGVTFSCIRHRCRNRPSTDRRGSKQTTVSVRRSRNGYFNFIMLF